MTTQTPAPRKTRSDLTPEEIARLAQYGSVSFQSAGATRQK